MDAREKKYEEFATVMKNGSKGRYRKQNQSQGETMGKQEGRIYGREGKRE